MHHFKSSKLYYLSYILKFHWEISIWFSRTVSNKKWFTLKIKSCQISQYNDNKILNYHKCYFIVRFMCNEMHWEKLNVEKWCYIEEMFTIQSKIERKKDFTMRLMLWFKQNKLEETSFDSDVTIVQKIKIINLSLFFSSSKHQNESTFCLFIQQKRILPLHSTKFHSYPPMLLIRLRINNKKAIMRSWFFLLS